METEIVVKKEQTDVKPEVVVKEEPIELKMEQTDVNPEVLVKEELIDLTTPLAHKVKRQLEYYFGDINYPKDKWMRAKAAENNGYIPIDLFLTFNRVKEQTSDINLLTAILKSIPDLDVVDGKVKRLKPIPDTFDYKAAEQCTVILRGFPREEPIVTIDEITDLLSAHATLLSIFRKKNKKTKEFRGRVFVQFGTPEEAIKILELKELDYKGHKIALMTKEQYVVIKTEELAKKGITYQAYQPYGKRQKENSSYKKSKKQKKEVVEPVKEEPKDENKIEKGVLVEIENVPTDTSIGDLKAYFARFGNVQFVDVDKLAEHQMIIIRFLTPAATDATLSELSEKKMEIKGNILEGHLITGEEEENYWKAHILPSIIKGRRKNMRHSTRGRGRGKSNKRQKTKSKPPQSTIAVPTTTPAPDTSESSVSNQPEEKGKDPTE